jgi:predicted DNA-binding antitoxin AbrB/MazE fold protein
VVQIIEAQFDGTVLRPDSPLPLEANTRVRITVETLPHEDDKTRPRSFLRTARSLKLEGPTDWSANLDDYLYGEGHEPVG